MAEVGGSVVSELQALKGREMIMRDEHSEAGLSVSDLQEGVLLLLEEAGIDQDTNDQIVELIRAAESRLYFEVRADEYPFSFADARAALFEIARCLDGAWTPETDYADNYVVKSFMDACATLRDAGGLGEIALIEAYEYVLVSGGDEGSSHGTPINALPEIAESLEGAWDRGADPETNWIARAFMIAVGTLRLHGREVPDSVLEAYRSLLPGSGPSALSDP